MTENQLAKIIDNIIPHILLNENNYKLDWGKEISLELNHVKYSYISYNTAGKGGKIGKIFEYIENNSVAYCSLDLHSLNLESKYVIRDISSKWLELQTSISQSEWTIILDILEKIKNRTYENLPIVLNLILDPNSVGTVLLTNKHDSKLFDLLAGSNYTYFVIDKALKIIDYKCISWSETSDKKSYSSLPNFLQPFSHLLENKIGISLTHSGDIIIYNSAGMIMSERKSNCTIYENSLTKNLYRDVLHPTVYGIACNLFDISWDISYRRHGALIIVTKESSFESHIVNKESIFTSSECIGLRKELSTSFANVSLKNTGVIKCRSIFLELSSVDGAVILDGTDGSIKAFGSIVETAASVSGTSGARSTAAKSASTYNNMLPIKISSDGDITLYKKAHDTTSCSDIILEFNFY
ncbi:MAG: diadenylate cyclase [Lachnospiraceae bacterium]|nr:diadenylate cyclase [Lachnospiraceae bacterium]